MLAPPISLSPHLGFLSPHLRFLSLPHQQSMTLDKQEEKEMEVLLDEIPRGTSLDRPPLPDAATRHRSFYTDGSFRRNDPLLPPPRLTPVNESLIDDFRTLRLGDGNPRFPPAAAPPPLLSFGSIPADISLFQPNYTNCSRINVNDDATTADRSLFQSNCTNYSSNNVSDDATRYYTFDSNLSPLFSNIQENYVSSATPNNYGASLNFRRAAESVPPVNGGFRNMSAELPSNYGGMLDFRHVTESIPPVNGGFTGMPAQLPAIQDNYGVRRVAEMVPLVNRGLTNMPAAELGRNNWGYYGRGTPGVDFSPVNGASVVPQFMRAERSEGRIDPQVGVSRYRSPMDGLPVRNWQDMEAFVCGDSLIIPGRGLHFVGSRNNGEAEKELKKLQLGDRRDIFDLGVNGVYSSPVSTLNSDVLDGKGSIYCIAKDQNGCRFLQRKFDEGKHMVDVIFAGVIGHVPELMVNPFGNYLMQKLLDVCSEDQRMFIIRILIEEPMELVKISLNTHGTRAVQKLIETLKTRRQIALVIGALKPGFLNLINDLNGNHVVQRCLQTLSTEDNKFIFEAAARHCVSIATHRHGCCVLQRCISHSTGIQRANLAAEISSNGLLLAQDAFGNYVVQYLLELRIPSVIEKLASQFKGNYVHLSMQKFSSNVVEKCIKFFPDNDRAVIILELLKVSRFEHLMQDPYANYVIQSALVHSKGPYHAALVEAARPHAEVLRTNPHCKKIVSLIKK